jgi:hypothetical protein
MIRSLPLALCVVFATAAAVQAGPVASERDRLVNELLEEALPGSRPEPGRELFLAVLGSEAFLHEAVGPFDLYVYRADGLRKKRKAAKLLGKAAKGLAPAAESVARWYPDADEGVVSGRRFPVVLASSDPGDDETGFERVLALLDHCEDGDYSGFKPDVNVWTPDNRRADDVFTWEVLLCNVAQEEIAGNEKAWFDHGIGYSTLNMLVNRLFAKGAWGPVPPWLKEGLVDELDIASYGDAWVAAGESTSFSSKTAGYRRNGWSGFVPEGAAPPPPVFGPPPGLKTSFEQKVVSDKWLARKKSADRHWKDLAADLDADVPVSFRNMAAAQTYTRRDRAYSRCVLHLLLDVAPVEGAGMLAGLDTESRVGRGGMRTADPLPVLFARSMGGVAAVDDLEAMTMRAFLEKIDRLDIATAIEKLGGGGMLDIADHRDQAAWLYYQKMDDRSRQRLYRLIVKVENFQQLQEWEVLGDTLDRAARAALGTSRRYPAKERERGGVVEAFRAGLAAAD